MGGGARDPDQPPREVGRLGDVARGVPSSGDRERAAASSARTASALRNGSPDPDVERTSKEPRVFDGGTEIAGDRDAPGVASPAAPAALAAALAALCCPGTYPPGTDE